MILSVSQRTDIVAFYSEWFIQRYRAGYFDVRNPFYPQQVSRIQVEDVDAIFFCTKNPLPILPYLDEITQPIMFHITLTAYKTDIESGVPNKKQTIEAIKKLSNRLGKDHVYVRYDPIFISPTYSISYHVRAFEKLCCLLNGYVEHIIISFLDDYKNVRHHATALKMIDFTEADFKTIGLSFARIGKQYGMTIQTCCEERNLSEYGFLKEDCMSNPIAYQLTGKTYRRWNARNQHCSCVGFVDIGAYNTCKHFCKYCYANYDETQVVANEQAHQPTSSLLVGSLTEADVIKLRRRGR